MDRRRFVQSGVGVAAGCLMLGGTPPAHAALASGAARPDVVFLDTAFDGARTALRAAPGVLVVPIQADPALLLAHVERLAAARAPLRIQGVSREAAPFCLQAALGPRLRHFDIERLGPDLFAWSATVAGA